MSAMLIHVENVPMAIAESDRDRVIGNLRELKDDVWELKSENTLWEVKINKKQVCTTRW